MKLNKNLTWAAAGAVLLAIIFLLGKGCSQSKKIAQLQQELEAARSDTVIVTEIIRDSFPFPVEDQEIVARVVLKTPEEVKQKIEDLNEAIAQMTEEVNHLETDLWREQNLSYVQGEIIDSLIAVNESLYRLNGSESGENWRLNYDITAEGRITGKQFNIEVDEVTKTVTKTVRVKEKPKLTFAGGVGTNLSDGGRPAFSLDVFKGYAGVRLHYEPEFQMKPQTFTPMLTVKLDIY